MSRFRRASKYRPQTYGAFFDKSAPMPWDGSIPGGTALVDLISGEGFLGLEYIGVTAEIAITAPTSDITLEYVAVTATISAMAGAGEFAFPMEGATAGISFDSGAGSIAANSDLWLGAATSTLQLGSAPASLDVTADVTLAGDTATIGSTAGYGLLIPGFYVVGALCSDPLVLSTNNGVYEANLVDVAQMTYYDDYDSGAVTYWATIQSGATETGELYIYGPTAPFDYYIAFGYGERLADFTASITAHYVAGSPQGAEINTFLSGEFNRIIAYTFEYPEVDFNVGYSFDPGSFDTLIDVEVLTSEIVRTPSVVQVAVTNAPPDSQVTFRVDGSPTILLTETTDAAGTITSAAVPVTGLTAGQHSIWAESGTSTAFGNFTVQEAEITRPTTPAADAPPANIAQTGVRKWVLQDLAPGGLGTYTFPINPASMTNPFEDRVLTVRPSVSGEKAHLFEAQPQGNRWSFSGKGLTQEFYDKLVAYTALNRRIYVIDNQNRAWVCVLTGFTPSMARRGSSTEQYFFDYNVDAIILDGPITPV